MTTQTRINALTAPHIENTLQRVTRLLGPIAEPQVTADLQAACAVMGEVRFFLMARPEAATDEQREACKERLIRFLLDLNGN